MASLNLPDGPYWNVWTVIRDRLDGDQILGQSGVIVVFPDGVNNDSMNPANYNESTLLVYPSIGRMAGAFEAGQRGPLQINVLGTLKLGDFQDALNLQAVVEDAIVTFNDLDYEQQLRAAGAETGQITFANPLRPAGTAAQLTKETALALQGQYTIDILRTF